MSRNYNLISHKFIAGYDDIPFLQSNYKSNSNYNISVEVINTDYFNSFFKIFDVSDLYMIYILDDTNPSDLDIVSEFSFFGTSIIIAKAAINFFLNIEYNNRKELCAPYFFRTNSFRASQIEDIFSTSWYEKEIIIGSFRKTIVKPDLLKLLESNEIISVMEFYSHRTEAAIEKALQLNPYVLDENEEYIAKLEISLADKAK